MKLGSIPLAYLALAWLVGIAAAAFTGGEPAAALAASGLIGATSVIISPRTSTLALVAGGIILIFAAGWHYEETIPRPGSVAQFNGEKDAELKAVISHDPDERGASRLYRLTELEVRVDGRWQRESGGVIMRTPLFPEYEYGELIEIKGKLETPPILEDFDYREYLLRQGIVSQIDYPKVNSRESGHGNPLRAALFDVRNALARNLDAALPEPESSLACGILFGTRSNLPDDLKDDMNATGTSHLVAVSGQNVVLVAMLMIASLAWIIGRRPAAWIALFAVIGYAVLVGGQPSVLRAAIMGSIYVVAIIAGRPGTAWIGLALAAAGMTIHSPQIVHDISFQLSFSATLGLIVALEPLNGLRDQFLSRWAVIADFPLTRLLTDVAVTTVAATAFTLPFVAINFDRVSLVAPMANLLGVPAFVLVAATSALAVGTGLIIPGSEDFTGWIAWPAAAYMIWVIRLFADMPYASRELGWFNIYGAAAYYGVLMAGVWWMSSLRISEAAATPLQATPSSRVRRLPAGVFAIAIGLASGVVWLALTAPTTGRLSVTFLDVGQGDAILIEGPAGHRILVDGGPSGDAINAALGRRLPFYDRRIDLIVLTHPQADHLGGLPAVLERYDVGGALSAAVGEEGAGYKAWMAASRSEGTARIDASRGQRIDLGDDAWISVLGPSAGMGILDDDDVNDASVVLRLEMGDTSFLLTGDIGSKGEAALIRSGAEIETTVLKVAHHGSRTSTSPEFLRAVRPLIDVISVGETNRYGHPTDEVLERLEGDLILRTDTNGDITLSTDGTRLWLETQRRPD